MEIGEITRERGGRWLVKAPPDLMIRLRRLFPRAEAMKVAGAMALKSTPEVDRDLSWVLERWNLTVSDCDRALLDRGAQRHIEIQSACERVLAADYQPGTFEMAIPPRAYQRVATELALQVRGLLLADDVGLGKTASAICMLTRPECRPALVVTLTHLPSQWKAEIERFAPGLRVHILKKAQPYDFTAGRKRRGATTADHQVDLFPPQAPDILVSNYHKLSGWADHLAGRVKTVVFDEIQELRKTGSQKYSAAQSIAHAAEYRLGLSATPVYNYGGEIHAVLDVVRPDGLGSFDEFATEWCSQSVSTDKARLKNPGAFGVFARREALMLRRTRADVARELPPLHVVVHQVEADEKALAKVAGDAAELARVLLAQDSEWKARGQAARELDIKLRQATGIAKAVYVATFVRMLVEAGEQVVLYGWHHAVYDIWVQQLADLFPVLFTGEQSQARKADARQAFIEGRAKVLIMSLRAGAGLDGLQGACSTVVFGELDWSPGVHEQATGRVYRDGQINRVTAFYLVADEGSDPIVLDVLGVKKAQVEGLRRGEGEVLAVEPERNDALKRLAERYLQGTHREGLGEDSSDLTPQTLSAPVDCAEAMKSEGRGTP